MRVSSTFNGVLPVLVHTLAYRDMDQEQQEESSGLMALGLLEWEPTPAILNRFKVKCAIVLNQIQKLGIVTGYENT